MFTQGGQLALLVVIHVRGLESVCFLGEAQDFHEQIGGVGLVGGCVTREGLVAG